MILQELCRLYDRLAAGPQASASLDRPGWSKEKAAWAVVIGGDGSVLALYPLLQGDQKYQELTVPEHDGRSGARPKPYFLCDKASYLFGIGDPKAAVRQQDSRALHAAVLGGCDDAGARAVLAFLNNENSADVLSEEQKKALEEGGMMVLCLGRSGCYIHERAAVRDAWERYRTDGAGDAEPMGWCSVTGEERPLARLFPLVTGVAGAQSSGASLVSYNFGAAESYGKTQAYNASMSTEVASKAGNALKYLLGSREHRVYQGGMVVAFWTDAPTAVGDDLLLMLMGGQTAEDEATRQCVGQALKEMRRGRELTTVDPGIGYHLLGLSPNAARLSVRFFESGTFGQLAERYGQYLRDTEMVGVDGLSFWPMMAQTATLGKLENIPSTLVTRCFSAMIEGGDFPQALGELVRSRMRADHGEMPYKGKTFDVMGRRAAVLKACRVRHLRLRGIQEDEKERLEVALNRQNENVGYLLGRLFAVLERAQQGAVSNANATIRDRYIGAASTTPARVFQPLLRGCQAHLGALRKDPSKAWLAARLERELDQIVGMQLPDSGIPKVLGADDQDMFFIGYYQERCDLWLSKADRAAAEDAASNDDDTKED